MHFLGFFTAISIFHKTTHLKSKTDPNPYLNYVLEIFNRDIPEHMAIDLEELNDILEYLNHTINQDLQ